MEKQKQNSSPAEKGLQVFASVGNFELAQRQAKMLSESDLVPKEYRGNIPNTMIALEMAGRIGASPLMVMQHLNIIHGKPSWSSTFIISAINACGRFEPLHFEIKDEGDPVKMACRAVTRDKKGKEIAGPWVTMDMARKEGWVDKAGSKWKTMPELMIRYRAAAFFGRLHAPEITMGLQTVEEVMDVEAVDITDETVNLQDKLKRNLNQAVQEKGLFPENKKAEEAK
jgi:hypothetical protein